MNSATRLPRSRTENLVVRELDDETLVYDMDRNEAHCLNRTVALVWNQCDGKTTATQAARVLTRNLDAHVDVDLVWPRGAAAPTISSGRRREEVAIRISS